MPFTRRNILRAGGAAAFTFCAPIPALAANGPRVFDLYRGDSRIGSQSIDVQRDGNQVNVSVDIDIDVRILGLSAYRYRLQTREIWARGALQWLEGSTNDNGKAERVSARRTSDGLEIDGSGFSGIVRGNPATTTYWTPEFLNRSTWISTQNGTPMSVTARPAGTVKVPTPTGPSDATRWEIRGDIGRLDLFYDRNGEWIGNEFEARGEQARFVLAERGQALAALWPKG